MARKVPRLEGPGRALARSELAGRPVRIVQSTDPGLVGLAGVIVDETLRTFQLQDANGRIIRVGKAESVFEFQHNGPVRIPGAAIEFRSAERTKKVR